MDGTSNETKKITKEYDISSINTLVDLNENLVNFKTDFKVFANSEDVEFNVAVADQTQVDNGDFSFREVRGKIGGNISWDKNFYKNHFLALKSKEPQKVIVELELTELPRTPDNKILEDQLPIDIKQEDIKQFQVDPQQYNSDVLVRKEKGLFSKLWFKIFIGCVSLIVGILVYKYLFNKEVPSGSQNDSALKLGMGTPSNPGGNSNEQSSYRPRLPPVPPLSEWTNNVPSSVRSFQDIPLNNPVNNHLNNPLNMEVTSSVDNLRDKIFRKNFKF